MSFNIQTLAQRQSSENNLMLQQLSLASRALSFKQQVRDVKDEEATRGSSLALKELEIAQGTADKLRQFDRSVMSASQRIYLDSAIENTERRAVAKYIHYDNVAMAATAPAKTGDENANKVRNANLGYSLELMKGNGAPADQMDAMVELSNSNQSLANGGDPVGMTSAESSVLSSDIMADHVDSFDRSETYIIEEDAQARMAAFRSTVINEFKQNHESNEEETPYERVRGAVVSSLEAMDIDPAANPDMADAFIQSGMEAVVQYRQSTSTANLVNMEGLSSISLIKARDWLNNAGYEMVNQAPMGLVSELNNNVGMRNAMQLAGTAVAVGNDALLYSGVAEEMKKINPLYDNDAISESARKDLFNKALLDSFIARIEKSDLPMVDKLAVTSQLERWDEIVDSGTLPEGLGPIFEQGYETFTEGFSTYKKDERIIRNNAQRNGRGITLNPNGNIAQVATDYSAVANSMPSGSFQEAIANHYKREVDNIGSSTAYGFVEKLTSDENGVLMIGKNNQEWLFGGVGSNKTFRGVVRTIEGYRANLPVSEILGEGASVEAVDLMKKTNSNMMKLFMKDPKLVSNMFSKISELSADDKTEMDLLNLEEFGDYYVPESVGRELTEAPTALVAASVQSAMKGTHPHYDGLGVIASLYMNQGQKAADLQNNTLSATAGGVYDGYNPLAQKPLTMVAAVETRDDLVESLPFLADGFVPLSFDASMRSDVIKTRESLEDNLNTLREGQKMALKLTSDDQRAAIAGTSADELNKDTTIVVDMLQEIVDTLHEIEGAPDLSFRAQTGAGFDVPSRRQAIGRMQNTAELGAKYKKLLEDLEEAKHPGE